MTRPTWITSDASLQRLKESIIKATGEGIHSDLSALGFRLGAHLTAEATAPARDSCHVSASGAVGATWPFGAIRTTQSEIRLEETVGDRISRRITAEADRVRCSHPQAFHVPVHSGTGIEWSECECSQGRMADSVVCHDRACGISTHPWYTTVCCVHASHTHVHRGRACIQWGIDINDAHAHTNELPIVAAAIQEHLTHAPVHTVTPRMMRAYLGDFGECGKV